MKLCTVCGVVTSRPGCRCTIHARLSNHSRHNVLYSTREWQRFTARVLRAWRGQHGNWCPGYQRDVHPAGDLTVDHVVPLAAGGAPLDIANCGVLCRSCNSTKGKQVRWRVGEAIAGAKIPMISSPTNLMVARTPTGLFVHAVGCVSAQAALLKRLIQVDPAISDSPS